MLPLHYNLYYFCIYFIVFVLFFNSITFSFNVIPLTLQQKQNLKRTKNMIEHFIFLLMLALAYPIVDKFTDKFDK